MSFFSLEILSAIIFSTVVLSVTHTTTRCAKAGSNIAKAGSNNIGKREINDFFREADTPIMLVSSLVSYTESGHFQFPFRMVGFASMPCCSPKLVCL